MEAPLYLYPEDPCRKSTRVKMLHGWRKAVRTWSTIRTVKKAGINPVVCINAFFTDTDNEINSVKRLAEEAGARVALSKHWQYGGEGALELADAVIDACNEPNDFRFLYDLSTPLRKRIELIAKEVYGADGVDFPRMLWQKPKKWRRIPISPDSGRAW